MHEAYLSKKGRRQASKEESGKKEGKEKRNLHAFSIVVFLSSFPFDWVDERDEWIILTCRKKKEKRYVFTRGILKFGFSKWDVDEKLTGFQLCKLRTE